MLSLSALGLPNPVRLLVLNVVVGRSQKVECVFSQSVVKKPSGLK